MVVISYESEVGGRGISEVELLIGLYPSMDIYIQVCGYTRYPTLLAP